MFRVCSQHNNGLHFIVLVSTCRGRVFSKFLTGPIHVLKHNTEIISRPPRYTFVSHKNICWRSLAWPGLQCGVSDVCIITPPARPRPIPATVIFVLEVMKDEIWLRRLGQHSGRLDKNTWKTANLSYKLSTKLSLCLSVSKSTHKIVQKSWRINRALTCLNYRLVPPSPTQKLECLMCSKIR